MDVSHINSILTSTAREPAARGAPGVVEDVPAGVEEVVVGAGEDARGARLHGPVPPRIRIPIRRGNLPNVGRVPHSASAGDGLAVEVAQLLTVDAAGSAAMWGTVVVRAAAMPPPPSPVLAVMMLMPDLRVRKII